MRSQSVGHCPAISASFPALTHFTAITCSVCYTITLSPYERGMQWRMTSLCSSCGHDFYAQYTVYEEYVCFRRCWCCEKESWVPHGHGTYINWPARTTCRNCGNPWEGTQSIIWKKRKYGYSFLDEEGYKEVHDIDRLRLAWKWHNWEVQQASKNFWLRREQKKRY